MDKQPKTYRGYIVRPQGETYAVLKGDTLVCVAQDWNEALRIIDAMHGD